MQITSGNVCMLHMARIFCYPDVYYCGIEAFCAWLFPLLGGLLSSSQCHRQRN